jgi:ABC-2 type transport system permease protein
MKGPGRYLRLLSAFGRFALAGEMAFRGNFLMRVLVEVLWLGILLVFYATVFKFTSAVEGWSGAEFLFFVGCYYAMEGVLETLFLENCSEFAELVRTGNLDFFLLKPIDEQFLITCRKIDWATAPKVLLGGAVMIFALVRMEWAFDWGRVVGFGVLFVCGTALAYSFLLLLTSSSVWLMRNQSLMEMWWLVTTLMRYPREIYKGSWGGWIGWVFWYLIPLMLVTNVPARVAVRQFEWGNLGLLVGMTLLMLLVSRRVFFLALRTYRSASS